MIRWSAHLSTLFADLSVPRRPAAAAALGAEAVESWWVEPADQEAWLEEVRLAGLEVVVITAPAGDLAAGERGFLNVPERYAEVTAEILAAIELAAGCGARFVNIVVGKDTGESPRRVQLDRVRGVLAELSLSAQDVGVGLLVEPQNPVDVPGYLLPDAASAAGLVERVGSDAVALLYDSYHAAAAGCDPARELRELSGCYGHVQYADYPGRGPAGSAGVALGDVIGALVDCGYEHRVGLEYFPAPGESDPLASIRALELDGVEPLAVPEGAR